MLTNNTLPDDSAAQLPNVTSGEKPDAGAAARDRLTFRIVRRTTRIIKWVFWSFIALVVVATALTAWWVLENHKEVRETYYRSCKWQVGDLTVTGQRYYSYPTREFLGFKLTDATAVDETTRINIPKGGLTVIGGTEDDKWGAEVFEAGDAGAKDLKPAVTYTFVSGRNIAMIKYSSFCK